MLVHPQFDPIALDLSKIGLPIAIHWYGLTYLVAFGLFLWLAVRRVAPAPVRRHAAGAAATSRTCCSSACWAS